MSSQNAKAAPATSDTVTVDIAGHDSALFEFKFRSDGSGTCRDIDCGGEDILFIWDPSILEGLSGDERAETLSDHARDLFWDAINDQLDEDRVLSDEDFGTEEVVFTSGSSQELEHLIQLILYSFPDIWTANREEIDVTICASTDSEGASVDVYCELMEDGDISDEDKQRFGTLIEYALDLNEPSGFHLEYNDGAAGRASGYYECSNTLSYAIPKPSFHELAVARDELIATLSKDVLLDEISRLLPKETEVYGERPVP